MIKEVNEEEYKQKTEQGRAERDARVQQEYLEQRDVAFKHAKSVVSNLGLDDDITSINRQNYVKKVMRGVHKAAHIDANPEAAEMRKRIEGQGFSQESAQYKRVMDRYGRTSEWLGQNANVIEGFADQLYENAVVTAQREAAAEKARAEAEENAKAAEQTRTQADAEQAARREASAAKANEQARQAQEFINEEPTGRYQGFADAAYRAYKKKTEKTYTVDPDGGAYAPSQEFHMSDEALEAFKREAGIDFSGDIADLFKNNPFRFDSEPSDFFGSGVEAKITNSPDILFRLVRAIEEHQATQAIGGLRNLGMEAYLVGDFRTIIRVDQAIGKIHKIEACRSLAADHEAIEAALGMSSVSDVLDNLHADLEGRGGAQQMVAELKAHVTGEAINNQDSRVNDPQHRGTAAAREQSPTVNI